VVAAALPLLPARLPTTGVLFSVTFPEYKERSFDVPRILIADDDADFVQVTSTVLHSDGYDVTSAKDGNAALRMMREDNIDLVLLDVMMASVLDGVSVAHEMTRDPDLKDIPIVMMSSIIDSPNASMFPTNEHIPIDAWLTKPVSPNDLLQEVARLIA